MLRSNVVRPYGIQAGSLDVNINSNTRFGLMGVECCAKAASQTHCNNVALLLIVYIYCAMYVEYVAQWRNM